MKTLIKHFLNYNKLTKFLNEFYKKHKILKREIKIKFLKNNPVFYLILDY
jgi:hypothetical protein